MGELAKLPNIGPELERQLHEAGIDSAAMLKEVGSHEAWLRLLALDPTACYNRLCALEGAVQNIRWHGLSPETKASLKAFYQSMKQ